MGGVVALLLAAGSGERLGRQPKAFVALAGVPMLAHSLRTMTSCPEIDRVVLVVPDGYVENGMRCASAVPPPLPTESAWCEVTVGGSTRQESVRRALEFVPEDTGSVICHDAARPFATAGLFRRVLMGLADADGAVPIVSSPDTVKRVKEGRVVETVPRLELGLVQTPQAFVATALRRAHRLAHRGGLEGTDDAMLLEAAGYSVAAVEGEPTNFKITTAEDLRRAERVMSEQVLDGGRS